MSRKGGRPIVVHTEVIVDIRPTSGWRAAILDGDVGTIIPAAGWAVVQPQRCTDGRCVDDGAPTPQLAFVDTLFPDSEGTLVTVGSVQESWPGAAAIAVAPDTEPCWECLANMVDPS